MSSGGYAIFNSSVFYYRNITALSGTGTLPIEEATALSQINTIDLPVDFSIFFIVNNKYEVYQIKSGTTQTASPTFIRPNNYNAVTNQKFWQRISNTVNSPNTVDLVSSSHTGNLLETTLKTYTIPANTVQIGQRLNITAIYDGTGGGNKTLRIRINANLGGSNGPSVNNFTTNSTLFQLTMNSEKLSGGNVPSSNLSINHSTTDYTITITGQLSVAGDSVTCQGVYINIVPE